MQTYYIIDYNSLHLFIQLPIPFSSGIYRFGLYFDESVLFCLFICLVMSSSMCTMSLWKKNRNKVVCGNPLGADTPLLSTCHWPKPVRCRGAGKHSLPQHPEESPIFDEHIGTDFIVIISFTLMRQVVLVPFTSCEEVNHRCGECQRFCPRSV